jgi:hypothetical protein
MTEMVKMDGTRHYQCLRCRKRDEQTDRWRIRRQALADAVRIAEGVARGDQHVILLSSYEAANLRAALQATGYAVADAESPLNVMNTGDWLGQVWQKLPYIEESECKPNSSVEEMIRRAHEWCHHHSHDHSHTHG